MFGWVVSGPVKKPEGNIVSKHVAFDGDTNQLLTKNWEACKRENIRPKSGSARSTPPRQPDAVVTADSLFKCPSTRPICSWDLARQML